MTTRRIVGLVLVVIGIVALLWGGVFWTDRDTLFEAGPVAVESAEREGFALPPVLGIAALIGGIVLLVIPSRTRV
jgi:drug/metabolite transporter (DMT)-like permease